jgi:hypothetical protein
VLLTTSAIMYSHPSTAAPEGRSPKVDRPEWHSRGLFPVSNSPFYEEAVKNRHDPRAIVLPPECDEPRFAEAMVDLHDVLGAEHVELNDGPLVDGTLLFPRFVRRFRGD